MCLGMCMNMYTHKHIYKYVTHVSGPKTKLEIEDVVFAGMIGLTTTRETENVFPSDSYV